MPTITYPRGSISRPVSLGLGAVEQQIPRGKVPGVRVQILKTVESTWLAAGAGGPVDGYLTRTPTKEEISLLVIPALQEQDFELVGAPEYTVEENPVWLWRKNVPECGAQDPYQLYLGSGPFKGRTGSCMVGAPNTGDTMKYGPKAIVEWSAIFRSSGLELPSSRLGSVREIVRGVNRTLIKIAGSGSDSGTARDSVKVDIVPIPPSKKEIAKSGTIGAIIGLALTIFSLGAKG